MYLLGILFHTIRLCLKIAIYIVFPPFILVDIVRGKFLE